MDDAQCRFATGNGATTFDNVAKTFVNVSKSNVKMAKTNAFAPPAKAKTTGNTSKTSFFIKKVPFPTGNDPPTGVD